MDGESNDVGQCTGNDKLLLMDEYYKPSTPLNCVNPECNCVLKCGGASCEANNGTCIRKKETCPPGLRSNAAARRCGCNNNATCKCCIPGNCTSHSLDVASGLSLCKGTVGLQQHIKI
ncbi:hypothetical protein Pcinc_015078 [Petrolisthes cinctipes]|uniref:Uncharacterized protein n=1 Tax=Petrolisthes cinctipes TaxID=88211 RepID=A0AAE1FU29_PETCI|nr:hypothetical protein Pcinc_015078 [Petrolisthes cinctipes]